MSATASTATSARSSHVDPRAATAVLAGIIAFGAIGLAISQRTSPSAAADRPAAGAVVSGTSMSGPRTATQKGLVANPAAAYSGSAFSTPQGSGTYAGVSTNRPPENAIAKPVVGPVDPSFDGRRLSSQINRPQ